MLRTKNVFLEQRTPRPSFLPRVKELPQNLQEAVTRTKQLSREEEQNLITRWQKEKDEKALLELILSFYKFIVKIASGYSRRYKGCSLEDLVSVGIIGFIEGLQRYELKYGCRLSTQIQWWIHSRIRVSVRQNGFQVRVPNNHHLRRCFFELGKIKERMGIKYIQNEEEALLAKKMLDVPLRPGMILAIDQLRYMVFNPGVVKGDKPLRMVPDERKTPEEEFGDREEEVFFRRIIREAVNTLKNERERKIFTSRRLTDPPVKFKDLGEYYNISRERVRQIEQKAFKKVQKAVLSREKELSKVR